jgi:hypothetical protein
VLARKADSTGLQKKHAFIVLMKVMPVSKEIFISVTIQFFWFASEILLNNVSFAIN